MQPQPTGFSGPSPFSTQPSPFQSQPPQHPQQQQQQQQQQQPGMQSQPQFQSQSSLQPPGMATGYPQQQQSQFQPQFQQQQQQQPSLQTQPTAVPSTTGASRPQTSSQIAQSFQNISAPSPSNSGTQQQKQQQHHGAKIPNQRLSFITAQDQAKFEQLFKSAVGDGLSLDGETAKGLLMRSNLPGSDLSKIW